MATSPASQAPVTPKKGLSPLQWVLIVLGTLFVLMTGACVACGLAINSFVGNIASDFEANPAKAAAELAVRMNPDLELVSSDDEAGTMTVRNRETGEEITVDFSEIAAGNLSFRTEEGEVAISAEEGGLTATGPGGEVATFGAGASAQIPDWVERYPGAEFEQAGYSSSTAEQSGGAFSMLTDDDTESVASWYRQRLEDLGYEVQLTSTTASEGDSSVVIGTLASPERTQSVVVTRRDGRTQVTVQYSGKQ